MAPRVAVLVFPGTNCELDVVRAIEPLGAQCVSVFHSEPALGSVDAVIIPGGFAHGDYLRTGALAQFSPIMNAVTAFAAAGGPVMGICNGFQILTETGLLPGALQKNAGLRFICADAALTVASNRSVLTQRVAVNAPLQIPINHFEGNFICDRETLAQIHDHDQVVLRYLDNPNGSIDDIAGICNQAGNVVGLMPHPERASDPILGSVDGVSLFKSFLAAAS